MALEFIDWPITLSTFYEHYLTRTLYSQTSVTFPLSPIEVYYSIGPLRMTSWILATLAVLVCGYSLVKYLMGQTQQKSTESIFCLWRSWQLLLVLLCVMCFIQFTKSRSASY